MFSDACLAYIEKYTDEDNFFDYYYHQTYTEDIDLLKTLTTNAYSAFIKNNPIYEKKSYLPNCDKTKVTVLERRALDGSSISNLSDKKIIDMYLNLRSTEAQKPIALSKGLNRRIADIYTTAQTNNQNPLVSASRYINSIYRDYIYQTDYLALNPNLINSLDRQIQSGTMMSTGTPTQQSSY